MKKKPFFLTTPIFYPNAKPHLGHAYTATLADILARFHRARGEEVYLLVGVDENTEKVARAARAAGQETREYLNGVVATFQDLFSPRKLNISYDQFIRTSDERAHWPGAQALWRRLEASGDLVQRAYEGLYCVGHEAFLTEKDLVHGKCPDHNEAPERLKETNWFFTLSRYTSTIREKIQSGELEILPVSRKNEILALLERGLEDVSFSRPADKVSVGIPVPGDPSQRMYVWCDALANYISALGFGRDDALYQKFWPADLHIIGKDILRFHAAIWPGMLLSAGLPLPKRILVHGFITSGGVKMSKTLGNVIDPGALIAEYGGEAVRWFLARHISPFEDGDITLAGFREAYNADLANGLGNLVSRIMQMSSSFLDVPVTISDIKKPLPLNQWLDKCEFNKAAIALWSDISILDALIQEGKPFEVVKKSKIRAQKQIVHLVKELYKIAVLLEPFMPTTSQKIKEAIEQNKKPENLFPRK